MKIGNVYRSLTDMYPAYSSDGSRFVRALDQDEQIVCEEVQVYCDTCITMDGLRVWINAHGESEFFQEVQ